MNSLQPHEPEVLCASPSIRLPCARDIWAFPKLRVPSWGPYKKRILEFGALYSGPRIFVNPPSGLLKLGFGIWVAKKCLAKAVVLALDPTP